MLLVHSQGLRPRKTTHQPVGIFRHERGQLWQPLGPCQGHKRGGLQFPPLLLSALLNKKPPSKWSDFFYYTWVPFYFFINNKHFFLPVYCFWGCWKRWQFLQSTKRHYKYLDKATDFQGDLSFLDFGPKWMLHRLCVKSTCHITELNKILKAT